jgi:hypothetical protein
MYSIQPGIPGNDGSGLDRDSEVMADSEHVREKDTRRAVPSGGDSEGGDEVHTSTEGGERRGQGRAEPGTLGCMFSRVHMSSG